MRDILVTADNADQFEMFSAAHIERMAALRKPWRGRRSLQDHWLHALTGAMGCIKQQQRVREMKDR